LSHDFSSSLKGFFQTNHPILEIQLWGCADGVRRALVNTDLAAFAELPVPFHLIFLFIIGPAGIRTGGIASEATGALLVINDWPDNPPVRGDEEFLLSYGSRRDRSEGDFSIFGNLYRHDFLLSIGLMMESEWV
jgi:hypothetical protein